MCSKCDPHLFARYALNVGIIAAIHTAQLESQLESHVFKIKFRFFVHNHGFKCEKCKQINVMLTITRRHPKNNLLS